VVLTSRFGATTDYDLYLAAFRIPDVVFTLVAGGALGSTLVPVFSERKERGEPGAVARLAATVFGLIGGASVLAAVLGFVAAPALAPLLGPGFSPEDQERLALLIRILLLQPILLGLSEVLTRYLNVQGHFATTALAPTLYNLPIILAALVFGRALGSVGLALGVVAGAFLYLAVQAPAALRLGFRFVPAVPPSDPCVAQIGRLMVPRMVGQGAVQLSFILTTRLATQQPPGSLVALNVGWVLTMLPLGVFGMAVGNAALPALSAQAARGELGPLGDTARTTLRAIMTMVVPAALVLVAFGYWIVLLLFGRGEFTREDAARAAAALAWYAAGLPAHGAIEILTRVFYALQDTRTPVAIGVAAMAANVVLAYAGAPNFGYLSIAAALSIATTLEALLLWLLLRRRVPGLASPIVFIPDPAATVQQVRARFRR
jgi:putative peptidoglycan lipid II flippase